MSGRADPGVPAAGDPEQRVPELDIVLTGSRAVLRTLGRRRSTGSLPRSGGCVVAANHVSPLDPLVLGTAVDAAGRVPRFLAACGLWSIPLLGRALRRCEQIPVRRNSDRRSDVVDAAAAAAAAGRCMVVYPEGRITRDPAGWPMRPRTGAVRIAAAAAVPVVPTAIWGPSLVLPLGLWGPRPLPRRELHVVFGAPVTVGQLLGHEPGAALSAVDGRLAADGLADRIDTLLAGIRGSTRTGPRLDPAGAPARTGRFLRDDRARRPAGRPADPTGARFRRRAAAGRGGVRRAQQ